MAKPLSLEGALEKQRQAEFGAATAADLSEVCAARRVACMMYVVDQTAFLNASARMALLRIAAAFAEFELNQGKTLSVPQVLSLLANAPADLAERQLDLQTRFARRTPWTPKTT